MRMLRKQKVMLFGGVGLLVLALAGTFGVLRVWAAGGITPDITVNIDFPNVDEGDDFHVTLYTPDAQVPPIFPFAVLSSVQAASASYEGYEHEQTITAVKTVLGGDITIVSNAPAADTANITGELQSVDAVLFPGEGPDAYLAVLVLDATVLDFQPDDGGLFASAVVRTIVFADEVYSGARSLTGIDEFASFNLNVEIRDLLDVDGDGNLIPDANEILSGPFPLVLVGQDNTTIVTSLDDGFTRGDSCGDGAFVLFQTGNGPIAVDVSAPCLADMQLAADPALNEYDTARLVVTISPNDPQSTLDLPLGVDPLDEFGVALHPVPVNLFIRTNVLLANAALGENPPLWTPLPLLPGSLEVSVEISGPGMEAQLTAGTVVEGYTYDVTMTQDGEDLLAEGNVNGWNEVDVNLFPLSDDRSVIALGGDGGVEMYSNNASAIYATNVAPVVAAGDDDDDGDDDDGNGGGGCFIATAAYGTPMAAQIGSLRAVRDGYLVNSAIGAAFVDAYYRVSPPVARVVAQSGVMKQGVRVALAPVVAVSRWFVAAPGLTMALALVIALLGASALQRIRRPYRAR